MRFVWICAVFFFAAMAVFDFERSAALGDGPIIVRGGGEGEYSVIFAHAHLAELARDCALTSCGFSRDESELFSGLSPSLRAPPRPLLKGKAEMGERLFSFEGADVWINQDLLWVDAEKSEAYDLAEAFVLWIRISCARQGLDSRVFAPIVAKARMALKAETQRGQIASSDKQTFEFLLWRNGSGSDRLAVRDPALNSMDLSRAVSSHLGCGSESLVKYFAPAWIPAFETLEDPDRILLTLNFGVKWSCGGSVKGNSFGRALIAAERGGNGAFVFDPNSLFISIDTGSDQ